MKKQKRKKIIKSIIAIVLIACFLISLITIDRNNLKNNPKITEQEWVERLYDSLGLKIDSTNTYSENPATGRFIATTIGDALNKVGTIDYQNKTDEEHIQLLIESGVLSRSQLNAEYSYNAANNLLTKVMDLYFNLDNYPNYCDINYKNNVNKPEETRIISIDDDNNKIKAEISSNVPSEGDIITYKDEFGVLNAKKVESIKKDTDNTYNIVYSNIEDLSEIIDEISFSGSADFSQLPDNNQQYGNSITNDIPNVVQANVLPITSSLLSNGTIIGNIFEWLEDNTTISSYTTTDSSDIEIYFKGTSNDKDDDSIPPDVEASIKIKTKGDVDFSKGLKFKKDKNGKETITPSIGIGEIESEYELVKKENEKSTEIKTGLPVPAQNELPKNTSKKELLGKLTFKNTRVVASGYFVTTDWDDEKNFVQILIESDVKIDIIGKHNFNGKIKIGELPLPIASTGGVVSINFGVYLNVSLSGQVSLEIGIDDCSLGINVSTKDGISIPHNHGQTSANINLKAQFTIGPSFEGKLNVFGITFADPEITTKASASVETLSKEPGYEQYPACVQTSLEAPLIDLKISNGKDSITGYIIDKFDSSLSYQLISKEDIEKGKYDPLFKSFVINKNYHIETDKYGKIYTLEGTKDICTHKLANKYSEDLSLNPDATSAEINANSLHYSGFVLEPKDVVMKYFDAVKSADYTSAIECYDPTTEKLINALGTITSGLNSAITGNYISFGELLSNELGPLDYEIIECETQKLYYDSNSDLINGVFTNIPIIKNFICTAADVRVKYRYSYNNHTKVYEETCRVNRYSGSGWRINANSVTSKELGGD